MTYEKISLGLAGDTIKRTDAAGIVTWIPIDDDNVDYQAYLAALPPLPD